MKKFLAYFLFSLPLFAQGSGTPNCQFTYQLTNRTTEQTDGITSILVSGGTARTPQINNKAQQCNSWYMTVAVDGFSAISLALQDGQNLYTTSGGTALSWANFEGTVNTGSNPTTTTGSSSLSVTGYYPWMSIYLASSTGTGNIYVTLYGWKSPALLGLNSGGSGGTTGPTGPTGPTGSNGSNGSNGSTGATGATGSNGSNGATGTNGSNGSTGPTGSNGSAGAAGATGATGSNGSAGATGATGSNGSAGATGATGAGSTNIALPALGVLQGSGCSINGSFSTASAPTAYSVAGTASTMPICRPQLSTSNYFFLVTTLPNGYTSNGTLTFGFEWFHPVGTSGNDTWAIPYYYCVASGTGIQASMLSGVTATATAAQGTAGNVSSVSVALTPSGSGVGTCAAGSMLGFVISLSATTVSDNPVLSNLSLHW